MAYIKYLPDEFNPLAIQRKIAVRAKKLRLGKNLSQAALSQLSGVSYGSLRKFESTGEVSLKSLLKIAVALGTANEFDLLFGESSYGSMDELLQIKKRKERKRGTGNE